MSIYTAYRWRQQIVWGTGLIVAGCLLLLDRADIIELDFNPMNFWRWWPWLLVISGLTKIIPPTTPRYLLSGLWEIFFAGWWYVSFNHIWGWGFGETWPALVVATGVGMLLRPLLDNIFAANRESK
ncbi:LiaF transmembrane domain-containing protein [Duganella violaceipulchra]|uniref:LiaF transmembrane domain-containing protein n=1 Tax=Duganella violaceipulchra TaxID=2849652 RepID=A0AA41HKB5_9BURK|nr:DUF5668 domain-containing protein [Duganella violaceicalia]MBV6325403.1 hypothetical protein [Duganella violaceicalia]MCP2012604.1 hypothetical protein [Duganella violaceicalia]